MDKMCLTVHGSFGGSVINEEVVYNGCVIVDMDKTIKSIEREGLTTNNRNINIKFNVPA